ncbi:MAG: alpha/beta hydrolase [Alphaproteobacteria bacterium]|nr:alpha/beta hydrolase [Alphaproteobacteria bacterium]
MPENNYPTLDFNNHFTCQYEYNCCDNAPLTILYLHGLSSNPWGKKPEAVKTQAQQLGLNFFRFELAGHGIDGEHYDDTDLEVWRNQTIDIIEHKIKGNVVIVGHCIGGWTALLTALACPDKVKGVVCTSTAPNLYRLLMHLATPEQKQELTNNHKVTVGIERMTFTFTERFMDCAKRNAITEMPSIPIHCPVHLLQGLQDNFIDWRIVLKLAEKIESDTVIAKLLKNTNHHAQRPADLKEINESIKDIVRMLK